MWLVEDMKGIRCCAGVSTDVSDVFLVPNGCSSSRLLHIGLITSHALEFIYPTELGRFTIRAVV
jgi:hypothetical protein